MGLPENTGAEPLSTPLSEPPSRRRFCALTGALLASLGLARNAPAQGATGVHFNVAEFDRARILAAADRALTEAPAPLPTLPASARRKTSPQAFFSEAPDWWLGDDGKPAQRNGYTNPEAFLAHTDALLRLNERIGALTAAWRLLGDKRYADAAWLHLRAWFLDPATAMEPGFDHASVLPGNANAEGRPEGIEDAIALPEILRASAFLCAVPDAPAKDVQAWREWCGKLLVWMTESRIGALARDRTDVNSICWTAVAAELARFTRNDALSRECTHRFRDKLLRQMNFDGAFPESLAQKRPFGRSLFTLECLSLACESLSTPFDNLWRYTLPDGRGMHSAIAFYLPAMGSRSKWPFSADVQHFSELPVRGGALLLAGRALDRPEYIDVWKRLRPDPTSADIARETPVRWPSLWATRPPA